MTTNHVQPGYRSVIVYDGSASALSQSLGLITGVVEFKENTTLTDRLMFGPGGVLKPESGVTVTLSGGVDAGRSAIFDLSDGGNVILQAGSDVYPEWFGAVADNSTASGAAVKKAFDVAAACGGTVVGAGWLSPYRTTDTNIVVTGDDTKARDLCIDYRGSGTALSIGGGTLTRRVKLENIQIDTRSASSGHIALALDNSNRGEFHNVYLRGGSSSDGTGLKLIGGSGKSTYYNEFYKLIVIAARCCIEVTDGCNGTIWNGGILEGAGMSIKANPVTATAGTTKLFGVAIGSTGANTGGSIIELGGSTGAVTNWDFIGCRIEAFSPVTIDLKSESRRINFIGGTWSNEVTLVEADRDNQGNTFWLPNSSLFRIGRAYSHSAPAAVEPAGIADMRGARYGYTEGNSEASLGSANRAIFMPVMIPRRFTFDRICFNVGTQSGNIDVGVYSRASAGGPGARIVSTGSIPCPGTGRREIAVTATTLDPGLYWIAIAADNDTAAFSHNSRSATLAGALHLNSAFPLPSSGAGATDTTRMPCMTLLRS